MKRIGLMVAGIFCWLMGSAQLSTKENADLDKLIDSQVKLEVEELTSSRLKLMLEGQFFKVKRTPLFKSHGGYTDDVLIKSDGELWKLDDPNLLVDRFRANYLIKEKSDALKLQKVLSLLFDDAPSQDQALVQKGNTWLMVQREWFGEKQGYIVTTDDSGQVKEINYTDQIKL